MSTAPDNPEKEMTFLEHLEELRTRLIVSIAWLVLGCIVGFVVARPVVQFLVHPFQRIEFRRQEPALKVRVDSDGALRLEGERDVEALRGASPMRMEFYAADTPIDGEPDFTWGKAPKKPVFFNPLDPVMLYFKAVFIIGLIVGLPGILFQVWRFVAPGLRPDEKRTVVPILCMGAVFFPTGAVFAWFMMSLILDFLLNFQIVSMEPFLEITQFVNFELRLMLGFGMVFELPLVVMFLTAIGVVTPDWLRRYRPHAIVVISILSMMFTPPDPFSMLLMMGPLVILYEISVWASVILFRRRRRELEAS